MGDRNNIFQKLNVVNEGCIFLPISYVDSWATITRSVAGKRGKEFFYDNWREIRV